MAADDAEHAAPSRTGSTAPPREGHLDFLGEVSTLLAASLDFDATLQRLASLAVPWLADWCGTDIVGEGGAVQQMAVAHVDPAKAIWARTLRERYPLDPAQPSAILEVLHTGRPTFIPHVSDSMVAAVARDAAHLTLLREVGFASVIVVPLAARGRTLGALSLVAAESGRIFDSGDLALAEEVARRAGLAVDNARLYREAQLARARAERLQAVTSALSSALTLEAVARVIVDVGLPAMEADAGAIYALVEGERQFSLLGYVGYPDGMVEQHTRIPTGRAGPLDVARESGELVVAESPEDLIARWPDLRADQTGSGDAAIATAPLLLEGRVLGVLHVAFRAPRRFSAEERAFLSTLARQCAQAMERARLYISEQQARARLAILSEAGATLASSLDATTTVRSLMRLVVPALADWCTVHERALDGALALMVLAHADASREERLREALTAPHRETMDDQLARVVRDGRAVRDTVSAALPAGGAANAARAPGTEVTRPASDILVPLMARGRVLGVLGLFVDATDRRYSEGDLALAEELGRRVALSLDNARLYQEAQAAIEMRDRFLILAAHELKTPLTALLGSAQLVRRRVERERTFTERDQQAIGVVVAQARRQRTLVETLLDLAQLQAGRLTLERAPVELRSLTGRIVEAMRPEHMRHTLHWDGPPTVVWIEGDAGRLERLVEHLIDNAVKYSPAGGPVAIGLKQEDQMAVLSVTDRGIGIPRTEIARLFERFYRGSNADPRYISGFGIGLYLMKAVVAQHGGQVEVESREGHGSTFRICLPIGVAGESAGTRAGGDAAERG